MRKLLVSSAALVVAFGISLPTTSSAQDAQEQGGTREYVIVYEQGATETARASIAAAGGALVRENTDVGVATVSSTNAQFAAAVASAPGVVGVASNRIVGTAPVGREPAELERDAIEQEGRAGLGAGARGPHPRPHPLAEPLADLQWDMQQINATVDGSYRVEQGNRKVLVGIIDTGVDGTHPDIAPNFSRALSRNFTVDIPVDANGGNIDGPCGAEPDGSCNDAADVDENGHGTHVASTIGSPINGLGIAGVAPRVTLVNLRAGQDSGFFFPQPTVDALTYAGNVGIDVVNMSYYVDPWLFNCASNPADTPEDQLEQRTIATAVQRALDYAYDRGVTLVAAAGNQAIDYTKPSVDASSPDFADVAGEAPHSRSIDPDTCVSMPSEGAHVLPVTSTGISQRKAYYSSFGLGYAAVAAPGGDVYDTPDQHRDITRAILAAYPYNVGIAAGTIDPTTGEPTTAAVIKDCARGVCAYYQYIQGTSMASPHAVGVAALIVSRYGHPAPHRGFGLDPGVTGAILRRTATDHPCPEPPTVVYVRFVPQADGSVLRVESAPQTCEGPPENNGFYGDGVIDALRAVDRH